MVIRTHRLQEKLWSPRRSDLTPENSDGTEALQVDSESKKFCRETQAHKSLANSQRGPVTTVPKASLG